MIDSHTHILPQMDDGSQSPEDTLVMLEQMYAQGVSTVFATPHFHASRENPAEFLARREKSLSQLISPTGPIPEIIPGAEVTYFAGISTCKDMIPLRLGDTKLILIEMPFGSWSDRIVNEICDIPHRLGLIPVLAHINRYRGKKQFPKHKDALRKAGVLFQCNCDALTAWTKRRWIMKQFREGNIHFFGSDCHNLTDRKPNLGEAMALIEKRLGADTLSRIGQYQRDILCL